jgi:hypothetical protein
VNPNPRPHPKLPEALRNYRPRSGIRTLGDREPVNCYMCGNRTAILSFNDLPTDHGRVTVYCEHVLCDARETEVIIVRDGTTTTPGRTDVRILDRYQPMTSRPAWQQGVGVGHLPMPIFVSDGITRQDPNGFDSSMSRMVSEVSVKGGSDYDNQEVITVKFGDGFRGRVLRPDEMVQIYMLILGDDLTPDQPIE